MEDNNDLKDRLEKFKMYAEMAWADGVIQPAENEFLKQKMREFNLEFSDAKKIFNEAGENYKNSDFMNVSPASNIDKTSQDVSSINNHDRKRPTNHEYTDMDFNARAQAKFLKDDFDGAIKDSNEAIRINPKYSEHYNMRAKCYFKKHDKALNDDLDGAIKDCDEAIRLNPELMLAYENRGVYKLNSHDFDGAIKDCNVVIQTNSATDRVYFCRGQAKYNQGDLIGAIKDYDEAIIINQNNMDASFMRILSLKEL